jgi:hypothetical protein
MLEASVQIFTTTGVRRTYPSMRRWSKGAAPPWRSLREEN